MYSIFIYNYDENYTFFSEMMNVKPIFVLEFEKPKDENDFDNNLMPQLDYEGYLYRLMKDNEMYSEGIFTADSLYEDLFEY